MYVNLAKIRKIVKSLRFLNPTWLTDWKLISLPKLKDFHASKCAKVVSLRMKMIISPDNRFGVIGTDSLVSIFPFLKRKLTLLVKTSQTHRKIMILCFLRKIYLSEFAIKYSGTVFLCSTISFQELSSFF